jgi:hypothetical protein
MLAILFFMTSSFGTGQTMLTRCGWVFYAHFGNTSAADAKLHHKI